MDSKEKNLPDRDLKNGTAATNSRSKENGAHLTLQGSIRLQYVRQGYYPHTFRELGNVSILYILRSAEPDGHGIVTIWTLPGDFVR